MNLLTYIHTYTSMCHSFIIYIYIYIYIYFIGQEVKKFEHTNKQVSQNVFTMT